MIDYKGIEIRAAEGLHEDCIALLARYVPEGSMVIDLAAGAGAFSARLADAGYDITANDIDDQNWAARGIPKLTLDLDQPLDAALPSAAFPGVVAMEVIEHLENPSKLLRDCKRLVADGGCILLSTPNLLDLESRLIYMKSGFFFHFSPQSYFATGHRTILPQWLLEILIDQAGLEIVERKLGGRAPASYGGGGLRSFPKKLVRDLLRLLVKPRVPGELDANYIIYLLRPRPDQGLTAAE